MAESNLSNIVREAKRTNPAEKLIDVYQGRLPKSIKDVFKVAKALVVGNEVVAPVVSKLAETPITNIVIKTKADKADPAAEEELRKILADNLGMHEHLKGSSFDIHGYSNAFSSVYFAPKRYLECPSCKKNPKKKKGTRTRWLADRIQWKFKVEKDFAINRVGSELLTINFYGNCPNGHQTVKFKRIDIVYHNKKSLRIIRWDPFYMDIDHYRALGRNEYYYKFNDEERKRVNAGDRIALCEFPWPYIQACLNDRLLHISQAGFWHFKLEGLSGVYEGWGTPKILSVLTALYTVMSIMKANEATSEGRINDLTIISPIPQRGGNVGEDPIATMGVTAWLSQTKSVIEKFKRDRTLTAFLPFPVKSESVYGQGRLQLVTGEVELYIRNIVAALGLPEDVIFSGGNYTSIAVAARILSNQAENARKSYNNFLNFIKDTISKSLTDADFSNQIAELLPYESADDFQKTNLMMQAALANRFPWSPIYKRLGTSLGDVKKQMLNESEFFGELLKKTADAEGRSVASMSAIQQYFQMQMANEMAKWSAIQQNASIAEAQENAGDPKKRKEAARQLAQSMVQGYPPDMWPMIIKDIESRDPELSGMVAAYLEEYKAEMPEGGGGEIEELGSLESGGGVESTVRQIGLDSKESDKRVSRSESKL